MMDLGRLREHIYDVYGALLEVHAELGPGLNEYCYQEGARLEFEERGIAFDKEVEFTPTYHGHPMLARFRVDFICKGNIVIECKSVAALTGDHRAQLFNYMRLLNKSCGILVNFLPQSIEIERYFFDIHSRMIVAANDGHPIYDFNRPHKRYGYKM